MHPTCYFQGCLSLCTQLWRGCFCTKTRRAPPTQLLLPAGNLYILSFTLLLFYFDGFEWTNSECKVTPLLSNLLNPPSLYSCIPLRYVLAFPFIICWGWGFFVPFASQLLLCSLSFPWLHLGERETFCFTWMFIQSSERAILPTRNPTLLNKLLGIVPSHCHSPCTSKMYVIPILDLCNLHC